MFSDVIQLRLCLVFRSSFFLFLLKEAGRLQSVDPSIKHRIHEMISEGVKSLRDMKTHLSEFITTRFGASIPDASNRRYWRTDHVIIIHTQVALAKQVKLAYNAIATRCQDKLSELSELSHLVTNGKTLHELEETLQQQIEKLKSSIESSEKTW